MRRPSDALTLVTCMFAGALLFPATSARATWTETVLHSFVGGNDGARPLAALLRDPHGNLYGTTESGGDGNCNVNGAMGCGTVFEVTHNDSEAVLYTFQNGSDGSLPLSKLVMDARHNLYGTTSVGGADNDGAVFEISSTGTERLLYSFKGYNFPDGAYPVAGLFIDSKGNLLGTTNDGGDFYCDDFVGCGAVFKLTSDRRENVIYSFVGGRDGAYPWSDLVADANGALFGTTENGGATSCTINGQQGCGTVFKINPSGIEKILYRFRGGRDGSFPLAGLVTDSRDDYFGTTLQGGPANAGTVFSMSKSGVERVLFGFGGKNGANPYARLIVDSAGNLYGTTSAGGAANAGTAFKISPRGKETVLYSFKGGTDGAEPRAGLIADTVGNLYGTTMSGGANGYGTVFKLVNDMPKAKPRYLGSKIDRSY